MNQYFLTTSIHYTNGEPHIGHALEYVLADVYARHNRQIGKQVIFSIGTDEHGEKIAEKAQQNNLSNQEFVDQISSKFVTLAKALNISYNRFIRTTDEAHQQRVQFIWQKLSKDIYKSEYEGWYCVGDEAFFTEKEVKANNGICPNHNRPYQKLKEENYFFRLSKYQEQIFEAINNNKFKIYPDTKRNEILSLISEGLDDISISRPKKKIAWGIDVPGDQNQIIYVWFEALLNYITVLGYPEHSDFAQYWPANLQIIGKDIIRFHAATWPAMLLSLGLELPKELYVHGFINVDGKKMSKSLNNMINPLPIIEKYGSDALRYFLIRHIPSSTDGNFTILAFKDSFNHELANELGNLILRVGAMINNYQNGTIVNVPPPEHDITSYRLAFKKYHLDQALDEVFKQIRGLNQYIEETKPWEVYKQKDPEHLKEILSYLVSSILEIAELLIPFMPETANKIQDIFLGSKIPAIIDPLFPKIMD